ncbi:hypothetical protein J6590_077288 [Homalodisca vitripennis]|nr:hypothetical protein J6590_077288 [Homalodisca vitripennis]
MHVGKLLTIGVALEIRTAHSGGRKDTNPAQGHGKYVYQIACVVVTKRGSLLYTAPRSLIDKLDLPRNIRSNGLYLRSAPEPFYAN